MIDPNTKLTALRAQIASVLEAHHAWQNRVHPFLHLETLDALRKIEAAIVVESLTPTILLPPPPAHHRWSLVDCGKDGSRVITIRVEPNDTETDHDERGYRRNQLARFEAAPEHHDEALAGVRAAAQAGREALRAGGGCEAAVVAGVRVLKACEAFNAGRGACMTAAGTFEVDAVIGGQAPGDARSPKHSETPAAADNWRAYDPTPREIRQILENPHDRKWTIQGFGMLRTYLTRDEVVHLHVWSRDDLVEGVSTVHDHPWAFESRVISSTIRNIRYIVATEGYAEPFWSRSIRCGPGGCALGSPEQLWLRPMGTEFYVAGQSYCQRADELHESVPYDGAVTVVTRRFGEQRDVARVCWPGRSGPDGWVSADPREATREEIERITKLALRNWTPQHGPAGDQS